MLLFGFSGNLLFYTEGRSGFSGFLDLAQNKKFRSRIPGIGIWNTDLILNSQWMVPVAYFVQDALFCTIFAL